MKRSISLFTLVAAGLLFVGCTETLVEAPAEETPVCSMPGADAGGGIIIGGLGETRTVSEAGNRLTLKCTGAAIANASGQEHSFAGFSCAIRRPADGRLWFTEDTQGYVSASGESTLSCAVTLGTPAHDHDEHGGKQAVTGPAGLGATATHWWGHGRP